jgi:hypothetical protein
VGAGRKMRVPLCRSAVLVAEQGLNVAFTYASGQTSSITIGFSYTNAFGSFSSDGNTTVQTTGKETYPYETGINNTYWQTKWEWGNYVQNCMDGHYNYMSKPYYWAPNDQIKHLTFDGNYQLCWNQLAGSEPDMGNTTATRINNAFSNTQTGFSGSSQTGYDTSADLTFYFGEHGYLCGNNPPADFGYPVAIP